jgi:chromosome segregation ATPase
MANKNLNNTLEEELRIQLVEQLQTINSLRSEIETLKRTVREEQDAKYRAYVKISDLQKGVS